MKILAVIPARAGSKGIPNKNIRLINGKPLISYAIENAKKSRFVTDIVVTSDSKQIELIAKQMGVTYKERNNLLCGDDVTLDAVIYDVAKDFDCDYVITMQPTSPTLNVGSLDNAIEYAVNNNVDTVISVVNQPHLAWVDENGKKIPAYKERLNRQYLPPYYCETGAFVISKSEYVTEKSRLGKNIEVFELSDDEAVDIDTFEDLQHVTNILNKKKVAIYVNGNNKRGIGHIYRALELADEFFVKPDIYYDVNQTNKAVFGETTHNLIPINGIGELLKALEVNEYNLLINDILSTSIDYMIAVKQALPQNAKVVNFEDDGEGICKADLVFNALLSHNDLPQVKAGEKYYIPAKTFMYYSPIEIKDKVSNVFIAFGGADPQNYTDRVLKIVSDDKYRGINFIAVLGRAKENIVELLKYNSFKNITVLYDIQNIPEIMSKCDVAITSRGRTGYELAILGIPSIAMAQNKREEKHGFVCNENGFSYLGLNPGDEIIQANLDMYINMSKAERLRYQTLLLQHDLKNGRERVMKLINSL